MQYLRILMVGLRTIFSVSFERVAAIAFISLATLPAAAADRPNILWITCEDMSPDLGCYGDAYARSPNIDKFATEGVRYTHCFTHAGVCAPSRSGLITGMYPCTIGSHNMRSKIPPVTCFTQHLRAAGYYCTNNAKTDYNFDTPPEAWDANGKDAHWRNRGKDQPFFAVFNLQVTHESQIRAPEAEYKKNTSRLTPDQRHDPALAALPPYYPDTPKVRQDWARYHDDITAMDYQFAARLREVAEAGLSNRTIVFFFSDHGRGLPRAKRWLYDSGVHVPLIVRWPERLRNDATRSGDWKPGATCDDLVAFVDLAPTVLSLAQSPVLSKEGRYGDGVAFLGGAKAYPLRDYIYGGRDRMDERVDFIRSVRDRRYKYIRNYQPWKPYAQNINYMDEMPTMQEWRRLAAEGKLTEPQKPFLAATKPREELYDCEADPHELRNLAADPAHADTLKRLKRACDSQFGAHDLGFLPEVALADYLRALKAADGRAEFLPYGDTVEKLRWLTLLSPKDEQYKMLRLPDVERLAERGRTERPTFHSTALLIRIAENLGHSWSDLIYAQPVLEQLATARSLPVRIAAGSSLVARHRAADGTVEAATFALVRPIYVEGLQSPEPIVRHMAALAIDELGQQTVEFLPEIEAMLKIDNAYAARVGEYISATRKK